MTSAEALKQYQATQTLEGSWTCKALLCLFSDWKTGADAVAGRKLRANRLFYTGMWTSCVGLFAGAAATSLATNAFPLAIFTLPPLLLLITGIVLRRQAKPFPVPPEVAQTIVPFLKTIRQDIHPGQKIRIQLTGKGHEAFPTGKRQLDFQYGIRSLDEKTFDIPFATLRIPLRNGAETVLRIDKNYRARVKGHKSRSGKWKTKTKWRVTTTLTATWIPQVPVNWAPDPNVSFHDKDGRKIARTSHFATFSSLSTPPKDAPSGVAAIQLFLRLARLQSH